MSEHSSIDHLLFKVYFCVKDVVLFFFFVVLFFFFVVLFFVVFFLCAVVFFFIVLLFFELCLFSNHQVIWTLCDFPKESSILQRWHTLQLWLFLAG